MLPKAMKNSNKPNKPNKQTNKQTNNMYPLPQLAVLLFHISSLPNLCFLHGPNAPVFSRHASLLESGPSSWDTKGSALVLLTHFPPMPLLKTRPSQFVNSLGTYF